MKVFVTLSFLLMSFSLWATPKMVVHFGKLSSTQERVLDRVFTSRLNEYAQQFEKSVEVVIQKDSTTEKVLESLKSPEVLAVIFLGHPAVEIRGEGVENRHIVNGFLESADGRYLTKTFMSAAHKNLQALSILTCHESAVLPLYLDSLPEHVNYYKSPTHNIDSLSNPLFEFTSYYATPQVLDEVFSDLPKHINEYQKNADVLSESVELNIKYRDLLSSKFDYQVLLDGQQIGILNTSYDKRGRAEYKASKQIKVERSLWEKARVLSIRPDDPGRPVREEGLKVVDDIVVTQVTLQADLREQVLFEGVVHIGDNETQYDSRIGLSFRRNWRFFEQAIRQDFWELAL